MCLLQIQFWVSGSCEDSWTEASSSLGSHNATQRRYNEWEENQNQKFHETISLFLEISQLQLSPLAMGMKHGEGLL